MNLPTTRFHPGSSESDFDYDDDHGWQPVLEREIEVDLEDGNEFIVDIKRDSVDDPWEAVSTDAPLEMARAAMDAAERKANR